MDWTSLEATVLPGHQVASGKGSGSPYPAGSIAMQKPFFAKLGLDLSGLYEGTLNLSIAPACWRLLRATHSFPNVEWTSLHPPETFSFVRCRVNGAEGWVYYPHPETKAAHFQNPSVIEVIAPRIDGLAYGSRVTLELPAQAVEVLERGPATQILRHPYQPPGGFESIVPAVHKASTVVFPDTAAMRSRRWVDKSAYTYGLHGTPTTFALEARIASIEGGRHALLTPSGLAAIALVDTALLSSGDHVLVPDNAYGPNKALLRHEMSRWGVTHSVYDPMEPASLAAALTPATRLVWMEAAGSVTLEFPDLISLVRCVRERAPNAVVALDNTWGAGLAFNAFELGEGQGVDLTVHALTKYPSGGGDVLMGSVVMRSDSLHERLSVAHGHLGVGVGGNDVEMVLRSLPSMPLRYKAQGDAALVLARWLATRREFVRVLHPALPGSPGHEHWKRLCKGAAAIVTVEVDPSVPAERVDAFIDALRVFRIGWSWAGPASLAVPYDPRSIRTRPEPYRGTLVRLCIGLEEVEDLQADLMQALPALKFEG